MTSDVASLKRKLAEHADVLKQARALADKVWEKRPPVCENNSGDIALYVRHGSLKRSVWGGLG